MKVRAVSATFPLSLSIPCIVVMARNKTFEEIYVLTELRERGKRSVKDMVKFFEAKPVHNLVHVKRVGHQERVTQSLIR